MTAPYYTGDGVPLKFTITDADGDVNPASCAVRILKPSNAYVDNSEAAVSGNEVSYNVPGSVTTEQGTYRVYFVCILPSELERTHKIEFDVLLNPERWPV